MNKLPEKVEPGDIISSELMTAILNRLSELSESIIAGSQVVPNVFGVRLPEARSLIIQSPSQLSLGFVVDVSGATIDPFTPANANLIVLNQSPSANNRVPPNTPINLLVSRVSGNTTPEKPAPIITHTETLIGNISTTFPVGGTMVLVGSNFDAIAALNTVTFDNRHGIVTNDPADPTRRLYVVVPSGIPGAPVNIGDNPKSNVVIQVQTTSSTTATATITVTAPLEAQPSIVSVEPSSQYEGEKITIIGANFTDSLQVLIRDKVADISSISPTQIIATVPDFPDIIPGPPVPASLKISIPDDGEANFGGVFKVRGS